jgi:dTDP-4-amino-4,6-dideoxygalactose transaminase
MAIYPSARPHIEADDLEAVGQVLRSGHLEEGQWVRAFEAEASAFLQKTHAHATVNGFSAIHVLLLALGVTSGDEVIIPSFCCPAVLYPVKLVGAEPIFADLGENSFSPSADSIARHVTPRTKVILYPYQLGFPGDVEAIIDSFPQCVVIEDIAQAFGVTRNGHPLGSFAPHSIASFYASKMVVAGDAGMVLTNVEDVHERCRYYTYYSHRTGPQEQGFNYHLTNLNAALGHSQLRKVERFVERRRGLAAIYDDAFQSKPGLFHDFAGRSEAGFLKYPILLENRAVRDRLKAALQDRKIFCGVGVLEALHLKEGQQHRNDMPRTLEYLDRLLCLPLYPSLNEEDLHYLADTVLTELRRF